ncbi:uncharacterized protein LOC123475587 [Daphnia magna]|uniref:uncharacterized protein LOC123475587 n=1 Tax=Daphnia magna TaxID=35525 RepID=UPI001E1BBC58|nr:uncharacterized protein LOC123475587 [Daphnia magna]
MVRLQGLLGKTQPEDKLKYHEIFQQYIRDGFIEEADRGFNGDCTYLPHRPVIKVSAETTKIRPVFDGSAHMKERPSINDALEIGPNLNPEVLAVLLRFRQNRIAWTADITQAFLQVEIRPEHGQLIRFIWVDDPNKSQPKFIEYRWKRVPFGLSCSPFILKAVILKHLKGFEGIYPETVRQLQQQFAELIERLPEVQFKETVTNVTTEGKSATKALGVIWEPASDKFRFDPAQVLREAREIGDRPTKRKLFSLALKIFDPLGLIAPVTLVGKLIMQKVWLAGSGWDEPIPIEVIPHWKTFIDGITELRNTCQPRWSGDHEGRLHLFCDASNDAYSVVAYLQRIDGEDPVMLCSKTRVAPDPKKSVSIPRLELLSGLLAARLGSYVEKATETVIKRKLLWTDSAIAFWWMKGEAGRWKQFVYNRVTEIRQTVETEEIRHCPGLQNPADVASRGATAAQLNAQKSWWTGPSWMGKEKEWPQSPSSATELQLQEVSVEEKTVEVTQCAISTEAKWYERFSSMRVMVRVLATMLRAIKKFKGQDSPESPVATVRHRGRRLKFPVLTTEETREATIELYKEAQATHYGAVVKSFKAGKTEVPHELRKLGLVWDRKDELIRCRGRHLNWMEYNKKAALILLPAEHIITKRLIEQTHLRLKHTGVKTMMGALRTDFWIPKMRQTIKKETSKCTRCQRMDSRHFDEIPAPLPLDRLQMSNPFTITGVDFAGPFPVESPANSGHKTKVYVCLFTCAVTRAVHLEVTTDQEISTFIFALRRFFARREYPRALYSDNAGTFTLAAKYLRAAYRDSRMFNTLVDLNIKWRFSPSLAPWWGGFWERMVQTVKRLLYKTYGSDCMEYDLFQTVLTEIEDTINTRPLTYVAEDDTEPLTPKQLVTGYRQQQHHPVDDEEREYSDRVTLTKRERLRRNLVAQWWKDFYTEYVMDLE